MVQADHMITRYHKWILGDMMVQGDDPIINYPQGSWIIWVCKATI